jgi:hypothetical protein
VIDPIASTASAVTGAAAATNPAHGSSIDSIRAGTVDTVNRLRKSFFGSSSSQWSGTDTVAVGSARVLEGATAVAPRVLRSQSTKIFHAAARAHRRGELRGSVRARCAIRAKPLTSSQLMAHERYD